AGQRLAQRPQDRDGPGHRRLEVEVALRLLGGGEQGGAVLREERLVRRDDRGAVLEGRQDQRAGRLDAADDLDDEVDVLACGEALRIPGEQLAWDVRVARQLRPPYGDPHQLD